VKVSLWVWVFAGLGGLSIVVVGNQTATTFTVFDVVLNAGICFLIGFAIDRSFRKRRLSRNQQDRGGRTLPGADVKTAPSTSPRPSARPFTVGRQQAMRVAAITAIVLAAALLIAPTTGSFSPGFDFTCGSVLTGSDRDVMHSREMQSTCDAANARRLTIALVIGVLGAGVLVGIRLIDKNDS